MWGVWGGLVEGEPGAGGAGRGHTWGRPVATWRARAWRRRRRTFGARRLPRPPVPPGRWRSAGLGLGTCAPGLRPGSASPAAPPRERKGRRGDEAEEEKYGGRLPIQEVLFTAAKQNKAGVECIGSAWKLVTRRKARQRHTRGRWGRGLWSHREPLLGRLEPGEPSVGHAAAQDAAHEVVHLPRATRAEEEGRQGERERGTRRIRKAAGPAGLRQ